MISFWKGINKLAQQKIFLLFCLLVCCSGCSFQKYSDFRTRTPLSEGHTLVIGFQGGRNAWNDPRTGVGRLAEKLRSLDLEEMHVETVENARRNLAIKLIHNSFDVNRDRQLSAMERERVRLVLYGMSFGGAAVVKTAKELAKEKIPIMLTVQVDSVGIGDGMIPENVLSAANFFQRSSRYIKGEPAITAKNPNKTFILGNFEFNYRNSHIDISDVPWYKKIFRSAHTKMDRDPEVWSAVEKLILNAATSPSRD